MGSLIAFCFVFQNETHYRASVTLFSTVDENISPGVTTEAPRMRLEVPILCGYMKNMVTAADFSSMCYHSLAFIQFYWN